MAYLQAFSIFNSINNQRENKRENLSCWFQVVDRHSFTRSCSTPQRTQSPRWTLSTDEYNTQGRVVKIKLLCYTHYQCLFLIYFFSPMKLLSFN